MAGIAAGNGLNPPPPNTTNPLTGQLYNAPPTTDPTNLGSLGAVDKGTNAGLALKALAGASGLPLLGSSSGTATGVGAGVGYGAPVLMPDTSAATSAAFARAKDQTGLNTRASLTAMEDQLGASQMLGSGAEGKLTGDIIQQGQAGLNEQGREQAIQDVQTANQRANTEYQGAITQRGQNINAAQQDAARQQQALQGLLSVINSSGMLY